MASDPVVFHCDADAFFAACHIAEDPRLATVPMVVAGSPSERHGVVLTASYPARAFGIRTAMPLGRALGLCPTLVVVPPAPTLYRQRSHQMRAVFPAFSPLVEPLSIDEAWLDMTGGWHLWGPDPTQAARALQGAVQAACGLTVSVGVSANKMLAKQVSDWSKPAGITVVWPAEVPGRLWPRPVGDLYGVGPKLTERLHRHGLDTVGQLAALDDARLLAWLGQSGITLRARARGQDVAPVMRPTPTDTRSVGAETTLAQDVTAVRDARPVLLALADHVASRLRAAELSGRTVALKYKTHRFVSHTHQMQLASATCYTDPLYRAAVRLFETRPHSDPVRLLGLTVSGWAPESVQTRLDWGDAPVAAARAESARAAAIDAIRQRFGARAIGPARLLAHAPELGGSSFERDHADQAPRPGDRDP